MERVNREDTRENEKYEEILKKLTRIETLIENYKDTQNKAEEAFVKSKQNEKDIAEINDKIKWLTRTIAAAIILTIMGAIIFVIKMM